MNKDKELGRNPERKMHVLENADRVIALLRKEPLKTKYPDEMKEFLWKFCKAEIHSAYGKGYRSGFEKGLTRTETSSKYDHKSYAKGYQKGYERGLMKRKEIEGE